MTIYCPRCKSELNLPSDVAGRSGECPSCGHVFVLPAAPADPPARNSAPAVRPLEPAGEPPCPCSRLIVCGPALAGALLLIVSFFTPWWSACLEYFPAKGADEMLRAAGELGRLERTLWRGNDEFYKDVFGRRRLLNLRDVVSKMGANQPVEWSARAWGWNLGRGIAVFVLGWAALGAMAATRLLGRSRAHRACGAAVAAGAGLAASVLALTVWFSTPGKNVSGWYVEFAQGIGVGTVLALAGGALLAAACGYAAVRNVLLIRALSPR
ncbi:MAG TPA: hypothetical protein DCX07_07455 [Phycisphaerales bacterium]|nr:hypothetical protein [Phycisphaerales bacterium]